MKFEKIMQKNITGLDFFGEVVPEGIARLESSFQDLFLLSSDEEVLTFERQIDESKNKRVILAELPEATKKISDKSGILRAILQEEIDSENITKIESIRYYKDSASNYYVQIIFEMPS